MSRSKITRLLPLLAAAFLGFVQLQCLLVPDDTQTGERVPNKRPSVRITAGASTSDTSGVDYKVTFRWNGFDDDGLVASYEWAVDDTVSENAWEDTTAFSAQILFEAANEDLRDPGGDRFTDWHTFYIRARDDENSVSKPDRRFFNAVTIAPEAKITFPDISASATPNLQRTVILRWDGEDIDSSRPDKKPVEYEYKLVEIDEAFDPDVLIINALLEDNNLLLDTLRVGSKKRWIRIEEGDNTVKLSDLPPEAALAFGIRAIDEAGALEPSLERNRNFLAFYVTTRPGQPRVQMVEPGLGSHNFPADGDVWEIAVPTNRELRFRWTGDASDYGSLPGNVNYALDIPDIEDDSIRDPNGFGGWIGWGTWAEVQTPIVFSDQEGGTEHNFWVKMRDISDDVQSERLCRVKIFVVPFTFERFALIVDDAKFTTRPPTDAQHDEFLESTIARRFFDLGEVDNFALFPAQGGTDERTNPIEMELEVFARYRHIMWQSQIGSGGYNQPLFVSETVNGRLSSFLSAGGRLFMVGGRLSGFMLGAPVGNFSYPKGHPDDLESGYDRDTFIWEFMKYRNEIVSVPTGSGVSSPAKQASGLIAAHSLHPAYPDLRLDYTKRDPYEITSDGLQFKGGIKDWEGVAGNYRPIEEIAGLDSLYVPVTIDTTKCCGRLSSGLQDAVIAQRYTSTRADTLSNRQQGRTIIFDFQPYWFEEAGLIDAGAAAVNWLVTGLDH